MQMALNGIKYDVWHETTCVSTVYVFLLLKTKKDETEGTISKERNHVSTW